MAGQQRSSSRSSREMITTVTEAVADPKIGDDVKLLAREILRLDQVVEALESGKPIPRPVFGTIDLSKAFDS